MDHWRISTVVIVALLATGCTTTPDLSGWAQNSADLAGAVATENKEVLERLDRNIAELQVGEEEGWQLGANNYAGWKQHRDDYTKNASDINAVMGTMVLYANSLANLAAAGETGKEAAEKINSSVGDIVESVGASHPISEGTLKVLKAFADAWTRAQAQNSLAQAMTATDAEIGRMAELVSDVAAAQKEIVESIRLLERLLIRQAAGPNRMSWFKKNQGYAEVEKAFADGASVERAAAVTYLIESLEPRFRDRERQGVESTQWKKARIEALDDIAASAETWRATHLEAATLLARCGGFRSLQIQCGNFTAANLKLAADQIRAVVATTAPPAN